VLMMLDRATPRTPDAKKVRLAYPPQSPSG